MPNLSNVQKFAIVCTIAAVILLPSCFTAGWLGGWMWNRPSEEERQALAMMRAFAKASSGDEEGKKVPTVSPADKPDFTVDIDAFNKEWTANAVAARSKYAGKIIRVSGVVQAVLDGRKSGGSVLLNSPKSVPFANNFDCEFSASAGLELLKQGQRITVMGRFTGGIAFSRFKLQGCTLAP